jgi:hypothetical protein
MRALVLVVMLGCTSREPCEPVVLAACPSCGPGNVLRGLSFESYAQNAVVFADGSIGLASTCNDLYELPPGHATGKAHAIVAGGSTADLVATGTGADVYVTGELDGVVSLYRSTEAGASLWAAPINAVEPSQLVAAPEGVYAIRSSSTGTTTAYAAEDGAFRWTQLGLYYPDRSGGLLQIDSVPQGATPSSATVRSLDASFGVRWTKTLAASSDVWVRQPLVTASGAIVVSGGFGGGLDLGDATVSGGPNQSFVAELDATGKTLWASAIASASAWPVIAGDQVVVLSLERSAPLPDGLTFDVFDGSGHVRTDPVVFDLAGNVDDAAIEMHGAPDGNVWLALRMLESSDALLSYKLVIGSQHYSGGDAGLLLELAP